MRNARICLVRHEQRIAFSKARLFTGQSSATVRFNPVNGPPIYRHQSPSPSWWTHLNQRFRPMFAANFTAQLKSNHAPDRPVRAPPGRLLERAPFKGRYVAYKTVNLNSVRSSNGR